MAQMRMKQLITSDFKLSKVIDDVEMVYITGEFTKHYVTKHFGDVYCYFESTNDLKADFDFYNSVHGNDVIRLFDGLMEEYNPIENYDRNEVTTIGHTGTIGNTTNGTMTNKVSAYDSNTLVNDGESVTNGNTTTTLNNNDSTVSRIHGNIGVTTSSQMLQGEAQIRFNNYLEHYLNRWITTVIVAYGDELNEVEYAPDTEYATTDYVDNAVDMMGDSLEVTIGLVDDRVDTLDNSLGAVITDIDSNIKPTIEELINDDSDHESRITALESAPLPPTQEIYSSTEMEIGSWIDGKKIYRRVWPVMVETNFAPQTWIKIPNINIGSAFILKITLTYVANDVNGNFIPVSAYKNPDGSIFIMHYRNVSQELHANKHFYIVDYIKQ